MTQDGIVVMSPRLGGGWNYHRSFNPMTLTEAQCGYIKGMGAFIEYKDNTFWIKANDPRSIEEYIERLPKDNETLDDLLDGLEAAVKNGDTSAAMEDISKLRRRLGLKNEEKEE